MNHPERASKRQRVVKKQVVKRVQDVLSGLTQALLRKCNEYLGVVGRTRLEVCSKWFRKALSTASWHDVQEIEWSQDRLRISNVGSWRENVPSKVVGEV